MADFEATVEKVTSHGENQKFQSTYVSMTEARITTSPVPGSPSSSQNGEKGNINGNGNSDGDGETEYRRATESNLLERRFNSARTKQFTPRPALDTFGADPSRGFSAPFLKVARPPQRKATVKTWVPPANPVGSELSSEEKWMEAVGRLAKLAKDQVARPKQTGPGTMNGRAFVRECASYYIKVRRIERAILHLLYSTELCPHCSRLKLTPEKFLVKKRESTNPAAIRGEFDAGTASGRISMGNMRFIASKATFCILCKLLVNALSEQSEYSWLNPYAVAGGMLDPKREKELRSINCRLQWEIDGRSHEGGKSADQGPFPSEEWPPARTRRIRIDWDCPDITSAYLVLLARPAGLTRPEQAAFLGQHVANRRTSEALIGRWLKDCQEKHGSLCNPTAHQSKISRKVLNQPYFSVIDVREKRLKPLPEGEPYVALSYTWGGANFYNTHTRDVRSSQKLQAFDNLEVAIPQTIRDAMTLVSNIGLQYLWVDSLCIIQDSDKSWACNVAIVDQIFGNAKFTICAADGRNPRAGLLGMDSSKRRFSQNIERVADGVHLMVSYPAEAYIKKSVWNTRAWTFQERLLSRRCIVFVDSRVFFQCRYAVQREDILTEDVKGWSIEHQGTPMRTLGEIITRPLNVYMECVKLYTQRHLTKTKDMLNAFKGLGNYISRILGKQGMLYGLPRTHFDWAILWQMKPAENVKYRGKQQLKIEPADVDQKLSDVIDYLAQESELELEDVTMELREKIREQLEKHRQSRKRKRSQALLQRDTNAIHGHQQETFSDYSQSYVEDMPNVFPTWSWAGWANSYSYYDPHMLDGIISNVQHWLKYRTWITWYIRDGEGKLKLVWEPDQNSDCHADLAQRWRGYRRDPDKVRSGEEDKYGRPTADHWPEQPKNVFHKTLEEFPFRNAYREDDNSTTATSYSNEGGGREGAGVEDLRYLQFWTWAARFRLQSFERGDGELDPRYAILDYKDDICGVIVPDRVGAWQYGPKPSERVVLEPGLEPHAGDFEFLAVAEAREFSRDECHGWADYVPREGQDWDLFYVLLVVQVKDVHYRFGLGKVTKEAFSNSCREPCKWKEIILG